MRADGVRGLVVVVAISLILRTVLGLTFTPYLHGMDGYFHLRMANLIVRNGELPTIDPNSWGGRQYHYLPAFHMLLATLRLATGLNFETAARAIGPLISILPTLSIFLLVRPRGTRQAFLAVLAFALAPYAVLKFTVNAMADALSLGLIVHAVLLASRGLFPLLCLTVFTCAFTHPSAALLLILTPFLPLRRSVIIVLLLAPLWVFLASLALVAGQGIAHQFVPDLLYDHIYEPVTRLHLTIGFNPIIGLLAIAGLAFHDGSRGERMLLALSACIVVGVMLGYVEAGRGIAYLTPVVAVFAAAAADRLATGGRPAGFLLAGSLVFSILVLMWAFHFSCWGMMSPAQRGARLWLKDQPRGTVATWLGDGQWIATVADQPNIMDGHFTGRKDSNERLDDLNDLFNVTTAGKAEEVLRKYDVTYVYLHKMHWHWMDRQGYEHDRLVPVLSCGRSHRLFPAEHS
jgi:hypothetical protein